MWGVPFSRFSFLGLSASNATHRTAPHRDSRSTIASRRWLWVGCQCSCAFRILCEFADISIEDLKSSSTSDTPRTATSGSETTIMHLHQPSLEENHCSDFGSVPFPGHFYPGFSLINPRPKRIAPSATLHLQCFQRFSIP